MTGITKTVHFAPPVRNPDTGDAEQTRIDMDETVRAPVRNDAETVLDLLAAAHREAKLISLTLKNALSSANRHGDYQVARSAAFRLIERLNSLIDLT